MSGGDRFDAYKVEYAVFKYSKDAGINEAESYKCGYSTYNCNVDHYTAECPRQSYLHKLVQYASSSELPPNFDGAKDEVVWNQKERRFDNHRKSILQGCAEGRRRRLGYKN